MKSSTEKSMQTNHKPTNSIMRAATTVASWTMLSRLLGFLRDIFIARILGAGPLADAFFIAFKLPNFFRRIFAEGTLTVALIPVLSDERKQGEAAAHDYLNHLAGLLLMALTLFTTLGIIMMPWLLFAFAPGFADEAERWDQSLLLARWMFPYLGLISLAAMGWAVLNAYRRFAVPAASPALLNIAIIAAAIWVAPEHENPGLALTYGVLLGGFLQLAIQIPALKRIGWIPKPRLAFRSDAIRRTMHLFGPAVVGVAAVQVNILVGTILATLLPVGAVSYLYYADRIVQLPLAVFGIAMGTALLPILATHASNGQSAAAKRDLSNGLAWLTWITLPATIGIIFLAEPIMRTLFEHGAFTHADSVASSQVLQAYALGLISFCWARVLSTACFAQKEAKKPVRFAIIGVAANIILAIILMQPLAYVGLALATSIASYINLLLLIVYFRRQQGVIIESAGIKRILQAIIASIPMGLFLWWLPNYWPFDSSTIWMQTLWLASAVTGGGAIFVFMSLILGQRQMLQFRHSKH
ncbi:MAG: murein biosynthesis integral membrane protein MurJ [Zetaproteobacteria bacterium]|nr:murein biosynthesis integral membrane protein MurJ [Zetaproteobacteria bacterium]